MADNHCIEIGLDGNVVLTHDQEQTIRSFAIAELIANHMEEFNKYVKQHRDFQLKTLQTLIDMKR